MEPVTRAHVFVVRDGAILALQQAAGGRWWEQPGGTLEPGEDPLTAAIRETLEETGLRIESPQLLREWSYRGVSGTPALSYMYVARSDDGAVRLSPEHTAFEWMAVDDYALRWCGEHLDALVPTRADFLAGMRENLALLRDWIGAQSAPPTTQPLP